MKTKKILSFTALSAVFITSVLLYSTSSAHEPFSKYVDENGNIDFPDNFRTSMVHLGSWFVTDGGASGFHDVYTEASAIEAYKKTGSFPDGATLVKELRAHSTGSFTTGDSVSHATESLKQWFVMVKDTEGRFADNPLWGEGWGWALYKPDAPEKNVATDYKTDCLGCHVPAADTDLVYIQGYPMLNDK